MTISVPDASRLPKRAKVAKDFQEHLAALEERGLVVRVERPINKDTELHPLARWQFQGAWKTESKKQRGGLGDDHTRYTSEKGAEAAITASNNGGGLAKLMDGGLMAVGTRLMALGLGMTEIENVARELFRFGRDKLGADQIGEIISGTPGLIQFA